MFIPRHMRPLPWLVVKVELCLPAFVRTFLCQARAIVQNHSTCFLWRWVSVFSFKICCKNKPTSSLPPLTASTPWTHWWDWPAGLIRAPVVLKHQNLKPGQFQVWFPEFTCCFPPPPPLCCIFTCISISVTWFKLLWGQVFFWTPESLQMVIAAMKLKDAYSLEGKLWLT